MISGRLAGSFSSIHRRQPRLSSKASVPILAEKSALNFGVNFMQPLLGTFGLLLIGSNVGLKLANALFRRAELL